MENIKLQPRKIIECPYCKYQYLPGEIFYPDNVLGQPINEVRDPLGKIIYEEYITNKEPLAEEHFICYNCKKPFVTEVELSFKTRVEAPELDFSNTSVQLF